MSFPRLWLPVKRVLFFAIIVGMSVSLLFLVIGVTWIGYEVKKLCQEARREYSGDCTEALISQLNDETRGFEPRNHAIWSLGQMGDPRALPVLQSYYTGVIPAREPYKDGISQYELRKAIALTSSGANIPGIFWKWALSIDPPAY